MGMSPKPKDKAIILGGGWTGTFHSGSQAWSWFGIPALSGEGIAARNISKHLRSTR